MKRIACLFAFFLCFGAKAQLRPGPIPGPGESVAQPAKKPERTASTQKTALPQFSQDTTIVPTEPVPAPESPTQRQPTAADTLKQAWSNLKSAFSDIGQAFRRKNDTVVITIANVDYGNTHVAQLREGLRKLKGVRSADYTFSNQTVVLTVACKGKPNELWDALPAATKTPFRVTELGAASLSVQCQAP